MANPQFKDQRMIQKMEVASKENQLWALIHVKGLLHSDVQDLYRKVRLRYENIILNDNAQLGLHDNEYSLWKLHYKLIDEFRKRIKRSSAEPRHAYDTPVEGFKLFLSDGIQFYQDLIAKFRECNGLTEESALYRNKGTTSGEDKVLEKCQFVCHRLLVCLGDLARYKEQYEKPEVQSRNWSVAASHYLEATRIWPDSGNPHNQLAVLAMYIGDEFLALYHCIRSLAVKNPFPDAKDNLTLLFEKNRSSQLHSLSSESHFNFLNPSERSSAQITKQESNKHMLKAELDTNLWSLLIRTISVLHLKTSVDDFPCSFASTMREVDVLMALDDENLKVHLETYQRMDSVRRGPYRVLQLVTVLIFIIQNLVKSSEVDSQKKNEMELTQLALTAAFILMGRCVERCLKASTIETCPLLPAVLVSVEWLVFIFNEAEAYVVDDKSKSSMSYFFGEFVDLLNQLNVNSGEARHPECASLWEDHELRGFAPLASSHALLDFASHGEHIDHYESGMNYRSQRIINAAIKITDRSTACRKWISYDKSGRKFCKCLATGANGYLDTNRSGSTESNNSDVELNILDEKIDKAPEECEKPMSNSTEEEEVILFRPLTRRNSLPISMASGLKGPNSPKHSVDQNVPSDECLRRATSLLIAQNPASQSDPYAFHTDMTHFGRNKSNKQQQQQPQHVVTDSTAQPVLETPVAAGPPSLNAWVFDRDSLSNSCTEKIQKSTDGTSKHFTRLSPIEEVASETLLGLSINDNEYSFSRDQCASTLPSSASYTAPIPSAPPLLLDDDTIWSNEGITIADKASDGTGYPHWPASTQAPPTFTPLVPNVIDKSPTQHRMSSSEWLRQYRETHNLQHHGWSNHLQPPSNLGNIYYDTSRLHQFSQWGGHPTASNPTMHVDNSALLPGFPLDPGFPSYQSTRLYGCGALTEMRNEQQTLLQYLKEREEQLQRNPTVRDPYVEN